MTEAESSPSATTEDLASSLLDNPATSALASAGVSGVLGFSTGYAVKAASKVAAVLIGTAVVGLQVLAYNQYIAVNWEKIERDVTAIVDTDDSGRITTKDLLYWVRRGVAVLTHHGPSAGGFTAGLYYGFRSG